MYVDTKSLLKPEDIIYKTSLDTKYIHRTRTSHKRRGVIRIIYYRVTNSLL